MPATDAQIAAALENLRAAREDVVKVAAARNDAIALRDAAVSRVQSANQALLAVQATFDQRKQELKDLLNQP